MPQSQSARWVRGICAGFKALRMFFGQTLSHLIFYCSGLFPFNNSDINQVSAYYNTMPILSCTVLVFSEVHPNSLSYKCRSERAWHICFKVVLSMTFSARNWGYNVGEDFVECVRQRHVRQSLLQNARVTCYIIWTRYDYFLLPDRGIANIEYKEDWQ